MTPPIHSLEYDLSRLIARNDAGKKLRCKPGFKQQGAVCKPIPKESGEPTITQAPNRNPLLPSGLIGAGIVVALGAAAVGTIYTDLEKGEADISHLQKIPVGEMPSKEILAKTHDFKPGEMLRKGFDITGNKGKFAYHYGICSGNGKIIEVDGDIKGGGYHVRESALYKKEGVPTTEYERVPDIPKIKQNDKSRAESLALAKSLIGMPFRYDLVESNCESFARAIVYGETKTAQGAALGEFTSNFVRSVYFLNKENKQGLTAQEMNAIFKEKGYSPEVAKLVFAKASTVRKDNDTPLSRVLNKKTLDGMRDPDEFSAIIKEMTSKLKGAAKDIVKVEMNKLYLIALIGLASSKEGVSRSDARELKCKPGFKQQGAVCKPIKKVVGEDENGGITVNAENRPLSRSGSSLAFSAMQRSPQVYGDLKNASGTVKIDHLEKIPVGDLASKEIRAKAEKEFKPGDMVRKGFDGTGRGDYAHHYGIYAGKGKIIEVDADSSGGYSIKESDLYKREVVPTTEYEKVPDIPSKKETPEARRKALALGKSMVGTPFSYDLAESNCESFARAIYYGNPETKQGKALGDFTGQLIKESMLQNQKNREGLTAQEINKLFQQKGYDPKVSRVIFKPLIAQRNKENAVANRIARKLTRGDSDDNLSVLAQDSPKNPWDTLRDPEEMEEAIAEVSNGYNGAAKQLITMEVYKMYLLAFFAMVAPKGKNSDREDAVKELKCKPGFKQQGAVCKPIKNNGSPTSPQSTSTNNRSTIPAGIATGIILGGLGATASIVLEDVDKVALSDISHLEYAPIGKDFNKEAIADEYDKKFKKGDLIRSAFPLDFAKGKYAFHYAIYAGKGEVIESAPDTSGGAGIVKNFAHVPNPGGRTTKFELVDLPPDDGKSPIRSREHTLELAESMVGLPFRWNVIESNCESFARTVSYGSTKGAQSEKATSFGIKTVTSIIDIADRVVLGGVLGRGLHSDQIKETLEKHNYDPEIIKSIFKDKVAERKKEIDAKNKRSDAYQEDSAELVDPKDFTELVKNTSANFNGVAKTILERKMFKTYLIALFASVSEPSAKDSRQDSFADSVSDRQRMMRSVISLITKSFGAISSISKVSRNSSGLITVYFHPLSNPARLIKFEIGNTIKYGEFNIGNAANYKEFANQRVDSLVKKAYSPYVTGFLSVQVRLDKTGTKQKKCVKGIPCKGECIPRTSICEVDIKQVADPQTIRNLDPVSPNPEPISAAMPVGDEDIYALMSIRDLRKVAQEKGVMRYSYMSQDQLRSAIKVHDADPMHQEVIRKSLQRQKDISTLKVIKSTEIGRAIGAANPALGRQFNLLSAIGRKYEKNPTEAFIYAIPALIGTGKVAMVLLQKQRLANIKESAGAAVNDAEKYRKDIDEDDASSEGVNFYVGGYGSGSKDLHNKVANSKLATEDDIDWIKNKTENITIDREGEHIPSAHNASQDIGNNITTGYNVVVNNTFKRGKNREAVELAAKMYAHGTTWRRDKNGVLSMPPIQILAAEDGGTLARDAIEILHQMPRDPSTKITGSHIADRVKLVTLGTPYFGESKADIPEVNLVGDGDPWSSLPFNRGSQTKRVTGVGGANQNSYTSSSDGISAIFNNMRSGIDTRGIVDRKSAEESESTQKKETSKQQRETKQSEESEKRSVQDESKREREAQLDKLIRDELKSQAGNNIKELDRLIKDTAVYAKASKRVKARLKLEREAAGFAKRSGV